LKSDNAKCRGSSGKRVVIDLDDALPGAAKVAAPGKMFPAVATNNLRQLSRG
jgi:hypothetical protein